MEDRNAVVKMVFIGLRFIFNDPDNLIICGLTNSTIPVMQMVDRTAADRFHFRISGKRTFKNAFFNIFGGYI